MTVDLVKELRDGLAGVTLGPWMVAYDDETDCPAEIVQQDNWDNRVCFPTSNRPKDAEHLARCSPENIAALLDHIEALKAALTKAKAFHDRDEGCNGFTADYEILRLEIDEALAAVLSGGQP